MDELVVHVSEKPVIVSLQSDYHGPMECIHVREGTKCSVKTQNAVDSDIRRYMR